ncbi:MAG: flippase-like domain-containing protein [Chloroflexi bacterium]|nr:flippase-like domain-containing protein [Chloroflexota bacterium]
MKQATPGPSDRSTAVPVDAAAANPVTNAGAEPSLRRRVFSLPTLIATAIAVAVLALAAWRFFDVDWSSLRTQVLSMNPFKYFLALALYYISFLFRGLRWRLIAKTAGFGSTPGVKAPSTLACSGIILMGWFANSVAFLRLGDAYRGYGLAKETGASIPVSLGTVLAERVQDMIAVLLVLLGATLALAFTQEVTAPGVVIGVAFALVGALIAGLLVMRIWGERFSKLLPNRLRSSYLNFQTGALASFRTRALPVQLALGIVGWVLEVARLYFVAEAIGIDVSFTVAAFAALANAMLSTIPTPGGFGFVEGGLAGVLILLGLGHTNAFAVTLVDRSISWVSVIVFGGLTFFLWHTVRNRPNRQIPQTPLTTTTPGPSSR